MNPYAQYQKTSIETANQGQLILMLYDGAMRFSRQAITAVETGKIEEAHLRIVRVQQIVHELSISLNRKDGGDLAKNLSDLYEYIQHRLFQANIRKEKEILEEIIHLLETLRDAWKTVFQNSPSPKNDSGKKPE